MWRQTGDCRWDGPREPLYDKSCSTVIQPGMSGYCECTNEKKMKKGCSMGQYNTCSDACSGGK